MTQFVYAFNEGNIAMKDLLGGKGANLELPTEVKTQLIDHLAAFSKRTGKSFSSDDNLLLVSVRSGAKISMPGMMDTILNLGLNDDNVKKLADKTNDARFAYDCYRRLLQMFGEVVYGIPMTAFDTYFNDFKTKHRYQNDAEIPAEGLQTICERYKEIYV
ncbi:MAG: PEP/pyruvate-binding domain-containing protein, partial [Staphylococcus epidermidis]|nr:PEP/pyruvate-binding domain-containing protein [Staphylococcus epidermidis]